MRRIHIEHFRPADKHSHITNRRKHIVILGNGACIATKNEKHIIKFLAETNRFFNGRLQELNEVYIDLFGLYRIIWFYSRTKEGHRWIRSILTVEQKFEMAVKPFPGPNHNYFVIKHLQDIIGELQEMNSELIQIFQRYNNHVLINKCHAIASRLLYISNEISRYGHSHPDFIRLEELNVRSKKD